MQTQKQTFYSTASGLTICPPTLKGTFMQIDGEAKRVGEHIIQFVPMGRDKFGYYTTEDPDEIAYLNKRVTETGDIFGPEEYLKRSTPPEIRAEMLTRKVEDQNRLIAELQAQQSSGKQQKSA